MGNRLSLQQAEWEEAEYHALVEAAEQAKQRKKHHRDIEPHPSSRTPPDESPVVKIWSNALATRSEVVSLYPPGDPLSETASRDEDALPHQELPTLATPVPTVDGATSIHQNSPGSVRVGDIISPSLGSSLEVCEDIPPTHAPNSLADGQDGVPITDDGSQGPGTAPSLRRRTSSDPSSHKAPSRALWHSWQPSEWPPLSGAFDTNIPRQNDVEPDLFEMVEDMHEFTKRIMETYPHAEDREIHRGQLLEEMRTLQRRILDRLSMRVPSQPTSSAMIQKESEIGDMGTQGLSNLAFAVGLGLRQTRPRVCPHLDVLWSPGWNEFPLKAFRGHEYKCMKIKAEWDDEALLREITKTYDYLRTVWRKWFSLKGVSAITMVLADHSVIYPHRIGPTKVSPVHNMRLRYLMSHPSCVAGRREFMEALTARTDVGIEFVERFQISRIAIAIVFPVVLSALLGIFYSIFLQDVSSAFTVAGYMTSAYSVCLVLIGVLNLVEL